MSSRPPYPIDTAGVAWGEPERKAWLARQTLQRSYVDDVLTVIDRLRAAWTVIEYGRLPHDPGRYPLFALKFRPMRCRGCQSDMGSDRS